MVNCKIDLHHIWYPIVHILDFFHIYHYLTYYSILEYTFDSFVTVQAYQKQLTCISSNIQFVLNVLICLNIIIVIDERRCLIAFAGICQIRAWHCSSKNGINQLDFQSTFQECVSILTSLFLDYSSRLSFRDIYKLLLFC